VMTAIVHLFAASASPMEGAEQTLIGFLLVAATLNGRLALQGNGMPHAITWLCQYSGRLTLTGM